MICAGCQPEPAVRRFPFRVIHPVIDLLAAIDIGLANRAFLPLPSAITQHLGLGAVRILELDQGLEARAPIREDGTETADLMEPPAIKLNRQHIFALGQQTGDVVDGVIGEFLVVALRRGKEYIIDQLAVDVCQTLAEARTDTAGPGPGLS